MIHSSCTLQSSCMRKGRYQVGFLTKVPKVPVRVAVCLVGGRQLAYTAIQDVAVRRHIRHMHARGHKG